MFRAIADAAKALSLGIEGEHLQRMGRTVQRVVIHSSGLQRENRTWYHTAITAADALYAEYLNEPGREGVIP